MQFRRNGARRFVALGLAYVLALQAILAAWAAVAPSLGGSAAVASGIICASHDGGAGHPSSRQPAGCPCGPLCHSGGCVSCGPAPEAVFVAFLRPAGPALQWSIRKARYSPRYSAAPRQARAPPAVA